MRASFAALAPALAMIALLAGCKVQAGAGPAGAASAVPAAAAGHLAAVHDPGQVTGAIAGPCHYRGGAGGAELPDPRCTPGAYDPAVTQANIKVTICSSGYTKGVRPPSEQTTRFKYDQAYIAYGLRHAVRTELDHLVSLELGGANDATNLWPEQPPTPNPKDKVENELHRAVCDGRVTLAAARAAIASDWSTALARLGLPG
jgi:hypothetical protein